MGSGVLLDYQLSVIILSILLSDFLSLCLSSTEYNHFFFVLLKPSFLSSLVTSEILVIDPRFLDHSGIQKNDKSIHKFLLIVVFIMRQKNSIFHFKMD